MPPNTWYHFDMTNNAITEHTAVTTLTETLARLGGLMARDRHGEVIVGSKNGDVRDVVTNIDIEISALLVKKIKEQFPDHGIYSEESGTEESTSDWLWSIDPIDGTSNYVRGLPHYSCVVTVLYQGVVHDAVVYAPIYDECYRLIAGVAYCNDQELQVTDVTALSAAYVNFHPGRKELDRKWASGILQTLLGSARKSMNLCSSALDLCYVAAGKTDIVIYGSLSTLDVAGALAIVRAAGGEVYLYGTTDPIEFKEASQKLIATTNATLLADTYSKLQ